MSVRDLIILTGPVHKAMHKASDIADFLFSKVKMAPKADYAGFFHESKGIQHQFLFAKPATWTRYDFRKFVERYWGSFAETPTEADGQMVFQTIVYERESMPAPRFEDHPVETYKRLKEDQAHVSKAPMPTHRVDDLLTIAAKQALRS